MSLRDIHVMLHDALHKRELHLGMVIKTEKESPARYHVLATSRVSSFVYDKQS